MIEQQPQQVDTSREQKRRGYGYLQRTQLMKASQEMVLKNQFVMRNRTSPVTNSKNVVEMYVTEDPRQSENYIYMGRSGLTERAETRNVNYIEIHTNTDTTKESVNSANGQASFRMSEDKVLQNNTIVGLLSGRAIQNNGTGIRAFANGQGDGSANDIGGVQLTYYENGAIKHFIVLDKDGIQMGGLPTSAPSATGAIWNDSGTLKVVT